MIYAKSRIVTPEELPNSARNCVRALETLKKIDQINGNVSMTLDKLAGIRGDLVRTDPEWESWDFSNLAEALRQWVKRNPVTTGADSRHEENRKKLFHAKRDEQKLSGCVYCEDSNHKAVRCSKVVKPNERKQILARKGLCFNCATKFHRASDCNSKTTCGHSSRRHHTSICEQYNNKHDDKFVQDEARDTNSSGGKKVMTDGACVE